MIHFVLPAFNEESGVAAVCRAVCAHARNVPGEQDYRIGVVDDGSTDRTAERVADFAGENGCVTLLSHGGNRGVPQAFRTGLQWALAGAADHDIVIVMEADKTNDPALIPMLAAAVRVGADAAVASRMIPGGAYLGFPPVREFFSRNGNKLLRARYRVPGVSDYTMFYRAYRAAPLAGVLAAPSDLFAGRGFAVNARLLLRLHAAGARFAEVPHRYRYNLKQGPSKMGLVSNIAVYGKVLIRP